MTNLSRYSAIRFAAAVPLALAALGGLAAPAHAEEGVIVSFTEIYSAFQEICDAHPGDPKAQIAVAKSDKYGFDSAGQQDDGTLDFENGRISLRVLDSADRKFCLVMGDVSPKSRLEEGVKLAKQDLGEPSSAEDGMAMWLDVQSKKPIVHMLMVGTRDDGRTVAGYALGAE